jgi:hypothetical protein
MGKEPSDNRFLRVFSAIPRKTAACLSAVPCLQILPELPNFLQDEGQGRFAAIIHPEPLFLKAGQFHIAPGYSEADDHSGLWKTGNN